MTRVVIDTNVIIAGQRSRRGAASRLLSLLGTGKFDAVISVALIFEYEDVLTRQRQKLGLSQIDVSDFIDAICALAESTEIHYQWRPALRDPDDEFVLETAIAGRCDCIVSFNLRNFVGAERFGIDVITPRQFLERIGEIN